MWGGGADEGLAVPVGREKLELLLWLLGQETRGVYCTERIVGA